MNERPIPEAAFHDKDAVEMLRVWVASRGLHCSMKVGMYEESFNVPEVQAWGKILADVARHLANALESGYGAEAEASLQAIRDNFNAELNRRNVAIRGGFMDSH
ncbi:DUF5076 domain-containing protein [Stenotrophomonas bentonitica]|uniref:DUF5076 domain-containing protein n=1 Tax=Stenotrophomonas bentonitica TaxID=1450134 RepID=UPI00345E6330